VTALVSMKDLFHSQPPQSALLKKHIAYYYFHQSGADNSARSFIYYPHYKNALSIYKDSEVTLENNYTSITKPKQNNYFFGFVKLTNHAAKAEIHPPFNKIGIAFQALGLNQFVEGNLAPYIPQSINLEFDYFKASMQSTLDKVYQTENIQEKVELLDEYFLSIYTGLEEPKMEEAVELLLQSDSKYTVEELAAELEVSRKTLLRLFRKHHNCSVIDYIKMIQFRKSIDAFQTSQDKATLTELAYNTAYYDQSDFINHFKKLTGFNPKHFFKHLSNLGSQDTYWTFD